MKCIVGLGDIGRRLELTKHNIGFEAVDYILKKDNFSLDKQKFKGAYTIERMNGSKVLLIGPMTTMNLLSEAVVPIMDYYNVNPEDLIVLYDDLDLEREQIHLRQRGSAGSHNGMKSTIKMFGTDQFKRIRIDVGKPANGMTVPDYVLQCFPNGEMVTMERVIEHITRAIEKFVEISRFDHVMNEFSGGVG